MESDAIDYMLLDLDEKERMIRRLKYEIEERLREVEEKYVRENWTDEEIKKAKYETNQDCGRKPSGQI